MKNYLLFLFVLLATKTISAQEVLFMGIHDQAEAGKSYWCQDQELITQIAKSAEDAQKMKKDFDGAFAKQNPISRPFFSGGIIIYEFEMPIAGFNCSRRVISWKIGQNSTEARKALEADKAMLAKEFKATPVELFEWNGKSSNIEEQVINMLGVEIKLKVIKKDGLVTSTLAFLKNTNNDVAVQIRIKTTAEPNAQPQIMKLEESNTIIPQGEESIYTLEPGVSMNLNLGQIRDFEIDAAQVKKGEEEKQGLINSTKPLMRKWLRENDMYIEEPVNDGVGIGIRG